MTLVLQNIPHDKNKILSRFNFKMEMKRANVFISISSKSIKNQRVLFLFVQYLNKMKC